MPRISLVICVYKERDLLERLLENTAECYDDLVVVHDGRESGEPAWNPGYPNPRLAIDWSIIPPDAPLPDVFAACQTSEVPGSLREFVRLKGGRFFEHPKVGSLEGQSPFAWWAARHDWILRLDADELPSHELKSWLKDFRRSAEINPQISGFTCIWPPWNGRKETSCRIPEWRPFLINRQRLSYFGLTEQGPIPDHSWSSTGLVLHHMPRRKSYGPGNLLLRKQAYLWRKSIALALQGSPLELPRWRWSSRDWPPYWEEMRQTPLRSGINRFLQSMPRELIASFRQKTDFLPDAAIGTAFHKLLVPVTYCFYKINKNNDQKIYIEG